MEFVRTFLHNLRYRPDGSEINPLAHIFFYITLIFGVALTFFGFTDSVQVVTLYNQSTQDIGSMTISTWGVAAMFVTVINTLFIGFALHRAVKYGAMLGFMLWFYAIIVYVPGWYWFQILAASVPNLFFWAWYYRQTRKYEAILEDHLEGAEALKRLREVP